MEAAMQVKYPVPDPAFKKLKEEFEGSSSSSMIEPYI
jgi:hypothetical protein